MNRETETRHSNEIIDHQLLRTDNGDTVAAIEDIPTEEYDAIWDMVETGFQDLNRKSYEKQDMTKEELIADLESKDVLKYVARDADSKLIGLMTVHIGFDQITWSDTSELEIRQKETDPDATPYYVGTLVVPVDERGTDSAANLLRGALLHFHERNSERQENALVFFDCADANYPWLGQFIAAMGRPSQQYPQLNTRVDELYVDGWVDDGNGVQKVHGIPDDVTEAVIDKQHYYAMSMQQ